jgi:anhydro-N-acetylmuramic acid kinase
MVGLMSGTSADGIDACVCDIEIDARRKSRRLAYNILHSETFPYRPGLRKAILSARTVEDVCRLNFAVAEAFAAAALAAIANAHVRKSSILAIASHGQTLWHAPRARAIGGLPSRSTLQVGDISVIAARTGITTVGNFRTKDIALGGQGAPLVPFVEYLLTPAEGAVWLNIGGIANITVVPPRARPAGVVAFDTGPGNTLIDRVARARSAGRLKCDRGGRLALAGIIDEKALAAMLAYPYFSRRPPKSTGPEEFGELFLVEHHLPRRLEDACATLAALTADTIAAAIRPRLKGWRCPLVIASGGGVYNTAIMQRLTSRLRTARIASPALLGIPPDAKEAFAFAVLGLCTLGGIPNNLPSATGASRAAVLGEIARPD